MADLECEHGPSGSRVRALGRSARFPVQVERRDMGKSLLDLEGLRLHCGCSLVGKAGERALRLTLQVGPEQRGPWAVPAWGEGYCCRWRAAGVSKPSSSVVTGP